MSNLMQYYKSFGYNKPIFIVPIFMIACILKYMVYCSLVVIWAGGNICDYLAALLKACLSYGKVGLLNYVDNLKVIRGSPIKFHFQFPCVFPCPVGKFPVPFLLICNCNRGETNFTDTNGFCGKKGKCCSKYFNILHI